MLILFVFLLGPPLLGDFSEGFAGFASKALFIIAAVVVVLVLIRDLVGRWRQH
jgi:hypothetical protein